MGLATFGSAKQTHFMEAFLNLEQQPTLKQLQEIFAAADDSAGHHMLWVDRLGEVQVRAKGYFELAASVATESHHRLPVRKRKGPVNPSSTIRARSAKVSSWVLSPACETLGRSKFFLWIKGRNEKPPRHPGGRRGGVMESKGAGSAALHMCTATATKPSRRGPSARLEDSFGRPA